VFSMPDLAKFIKAMHYGPCLKHYKPLWSAWPDHPQYLAAKLWEQDGRSLAASVRSFFLESNTLTRFCTLSGIDMCPVHANQGRVLPVL